MSIHMHIAIARRDGADVAGIDIASKLGRGVLAVNAKATSRGVIGGMSKRLAAGKRGRR
jgi:hypothetical protein